MKQELMKGNDAVVYGALMGGATHFFGYPITPASEIAHTASLEFRRSGRGFLQAEDEVNAVNMLYGCASGGGRPFTASSGPGISLMSEGLSYLAGAELPSVVVDVQRAGPGLGNIWPEQGDYNMVVKGGGHGNYRNIVLAPASAQEMCDMTYQAFELADRFRMTVFVLSDAYIGQMMEPVTIPDRLDRNIRKPWAVYGDEESRENLISSIFMSPELQGGHNEHLQEKYEELQPLAKAEHYRTEDAEICFAAYGISARICMTAVDQLRQEGIRAGLVRLQTLYPFPERNIHEIGQKCSTVITVELSNGMLAEDVERFIPSETRRLRYLWMGGKVPTPQEITARIKEDIQHD